jgi:hypothetical protein
MASEGEDEESFVCVCEGNPCVCREVDAMVDEANSVRVLNRGIKLDPDAFDVGPGTVFENNEPTVNIYVWRPSVGPDMEFTQEPALTIGLTKAATAKLMWCLTQAADENGWIEHPPEDEDE